MNIRSFAHKGLKRLYEEDSAKGVPPDTVDKLRKMFAFLDGMDDPEDCVRYQPGRRTYWPAIGGACGA